MKNIPTIFCWDKATGQLIDKPLRMVEWVFQTKGVATRKWDGVCIKVERSKVYRRYEWKEGELPPTGFVRCQDPDPKRPHARIPGWVPVPDTFKTKPQTRDERALREAWEGLIQDLTKTVPVKKNVVVNPYGPKTPEKVGPANVPDGTYELCGPDIHGNHEKFKKHVLLRHGDHIEKNVPRKFEALKKFLETYEGEGIVWHMNLGGQTLMAKIKRSDFGFRTRFSKEDIAMAYRKEEPPTTPQDSVPQPAEIKAVSTEIPKVDSAFPAVFEADNAETGDDIHLEVPSAV